jgi:hypothetical protein
MRNIDELLAHLRSRQVNVWVEGDALRYRAPKGSLTQELRGELAAHKSGIMQYLNQALAEKTTGHEEIPVLPAQEDYALSHGQKRLLILDQLESGITTHNMFTSHRITGNLDPRLLDRE